MGFPKHFFSRCFTEIFVIVSYLLGTYVSLAFYTRFKMLSLSIMPSWAFLITLSVGVSLKFSGL